MAQRMPALKQLTVEDEFYDAPEEVRSRSGARRGRAMPVPPQAPITYSCPLRGAGRRVP